MCPPDKEAIYKHFEFLTSASFQAPKGKISTILPFPEGFSENPVNTFINLQ